jgi:predicted MFS family arabinose efflux permease
MFSESFHIDYIYMGFLISIYSIFTLFSPIFGSLSDQYGRRSFLTIGSMIFAISSVIMVVAQNWTHILVARALAGLANAIFFPAFLALLGDKYSYDKRTRAMGFVRLAWPITFIFGAPLVGYSIEYLNWRFPFFLMAIVALITGIAINLVSSSNDESKSQKSKPTPSLDLFKRVLLDRYAVSGLLMILLAVGAIQGIFAFFPAWLETEFLLQESTISFIYAFMGVGTLIGTLLATRIGDHFGAKICAVTGLAIASGCMLMLSQFSYSPIFVILWLLLLGTAFDFSVTVGPVLLTQLAPDAKGTIISLDRALKGGATAISTALSSLLFTYYGYGVIGLVFASTALIGALIGFFTIRVVSDSELPPQTTIGDEQLS